MDEPIENKFTDEQSSSSKPTLSQSDSGRMLRRDALKLVGAAGATALLAPLMQVTTQADWLVTEGDPNLSRDRLLDADWRFFRGDIPGVEAPDFNDSTWRLLDVPHDWTIEDLPGSAPAGSAADTADPAVWSAATTSVVIGPFTQTGSENGSPTGWTVDGIGWYRKHISQAELPTGRQVEVRFDGVYMNADVWLNGVHVGFHPYGYTTFAYDLTPYLKPGVDNVLAVRVRNVGDNARFYSGSGIYRHVWLTITGPVRIPLWGVGVTTPAVSSGAATVKTEVMVESREAAVRGAIVQVRLRDSRGREVAVGQLQQNLPVGVKTQFTISLALSSPNLWSPEEPNLYSAEAQVIVSNKVVDAMAIPFGVRLVQMDGTHGLRINGRTVKLKGGCVHSSAGPLGAAAIDRAEERRVELLKAYGFNAIRTAHNPPSPAFLDACDRLGMLVYEEAFDVWTIAKRPDDYSQYFLDWWRVDLSSMVLRDRNRPSVILWSIGNEISGTRTSPEVISLGHALHDLVHQLDPTRLVTGGGFMAIDGIFLPENDGPEWQYLDVGDYHYNISTYESAHVAHPAVPFVSSESWPDPPNNDVPPTLAMYDFWQAVQKYSWVMGDFTWTGIDYLGESGLGHVQLGPPGSVFTLSGTDLSEPWPWFQAYCGDIDLIGEKKPQSYYRDVLWGRSNLEMAVARPTPAGQIQLTDFWGWYDELQSWTWPIPVGTSMIVRVYTTGDQVRLLLNGAEVATTTLTAADKLIAEFNVPYAAGELMAIASLKGNVIAQKSLVTVGVATTLRLRTDRTRLQRNRNDLAHVIVEVLDCSGQLVPDAVVTVKFHLQGAGELTAVANANPHNVDSFKQPQRETYHGRCLAVVRPLGWRGPIWLLADSEGLAPAILTLEVT
jgi:beta-galactosidase